MRKGLKRSVSGTTALWDLAALGATVMWSLTACVYDYPDCAVAGTEISVRYDLAHVNGRPEGMTALFYPDDGQEYWRYDLRLTGGDVELVGGTYHAVTFNNDPETVIVRGLDSRNTIEAYTRTASITDGLSLDYSGAAPPLGRVADLPVVTAPDMLWADAPGSPVNVPSCPEITFTPHPVVAVYRIHVTDITNLSSVSEASLSLSGLAGNYLIGLSRKGGTVVTIPGRAVTAGNSVMEGSITTFGYAPAAGSCLLRLYLWLHNGEKKIYEFEVRDQILNAADSMEVDIHVGHLMLPDTGSAPDNPGNGLGVNVDNWETVEIELST